MKATARKKKQVRDVSRPRTASFVIFDLGAGEGSSTRSRQLRALNNIISTTNAFRRIGYRRDPWIPHRSRSASDESWSKGESSDLLWLGFGYFCPRAVVGSPACPCRIRVGSYSSSARTQHANALTILLTASNPSFSFEFKFLDS